MLFVPDFSKGKKNAMNYAEIENTSGGLLPYPSGKSKEL